MIQYRHFGLEAHSVAYAYSAAEGQDGERPPTVPTLEEIEKADRLRHDLELKYLGFADPCPCASRENVQAPAGTDPSPDTPARRPDA